MSEMQTILSRLNENGLAHQILPLQNGVNAVITARGGRVLGPFLPSGESVTWLAECWNSPDAFRDFLAGGAWNQGGDRVWLAPEIQFAVKDRKRFWETLQTPREMDPGEYGLATTSGGISLERSFDLAVYYPESARKRLSLRRVVAPAPDPLRELPDGKTLLNNVRYAGYNQEITLCDLDGNSVMVESWNLSQVKPGGELFIKVHNGEAVRPVDYYEPVDAAHMDVAGDMIRMKITGDRCYKVGFKAAIVTGRMAYLRRRQGGSLLYVRHFFSNPSAFYNEEPPLSPGVKGCSVHVYNDSGTSGGFGELENNGQAVGGSTGRSVSIDSFVTWIFDGADAAIDLVFESLMGRSGFRPGS